MMNEIQSIVLESKQNNWPYPKRFAALKNAGALTHIVHFINGFDSVYQSESGTWQEPSFADYISPVLLETFSEDGIKAALMERAQGKTTYMQFLTAIASCGVSHYKADMCNDIVTYFNDAEDTFYIQPVPVWKE